MLELITLELGDLRSNCYILHNGVNCVIIDPGATAYKIFDVLNDARLIPEAVIITHGHFDHIGAVDQICSEYNIPLVIHADDTSFLNEPSYNLSSSFFESELTLKTSNIITVTENTLEFLGTVFEFIHTPGHSPGSVCILVDDKLFTGDTLFYMSVGNQFPPFGNLDLEIQSIKQKLLTLHKDYDCYPGHGPKTSLFFEKENNPYLDNYSYGY